MTRQDLIALAPLIALAGSVLVLMLIVAFRRNHLVATTFTLFGLAVAFASTWLAARVIPQFVTSLLVVDSYGLFYIRFLLATAAAIVLLAHPYVERRNEHKEEFYILISLATVGSLVLVSSRHFGSLFLGIEILSISLYALISYLRAARLPLEAGVKYLILAAASSAFLLFGMALLYAETGSLDLAEIAPLFTNAAPIARPALGYVGITLMLTGIGFKLAVAPFHFWTPDVYQGAPLPVTAFIASVSKAGVFGLLLRWFHSVSLNLDSPAGWAFLFLAVASMLGGNILALQQNNVKRLLAYSSIGHMGYLMVAFLAGGALGVQAATYYLVAYVVTIVGAFGVLTVVSGVGEEHCELADLPGLFRGRPLLSGIWAAMVMSLAGIPLTAGFLGKFYVLSAAASSALWIPVFVLVVSSTIGIYYYLRIFVALFSGSVDDYGITPGRDTDVSLGASFSLAVLMILLFALGVYPAPFWSWVLTMSASL